METLGSRGRAPVLNPRVGSWCLWNIWSPQKGRKRFVTRVPTAICFTDPRPTELAAPCLPFCANRGSKP